MHSNPENRISRQQKRSKSYWVWVLLAAALIVGVYFYSAGQAPDSEPAPAPPPPPPPVTETIPEPSLPPAPDIPKAPKAALLVVTEEPVASPPSLETSDQELRAGMKGASASTFLTTALASDNLVERSASIVDSFSRGAVPYKALPIKAPAEKFGVLKVDDKIYMDPASYHRYDSYAQAIGELNTQTLSDNFKRFRPLLEQAYAALGYPAEDFDNALIRSLDRILATPERQQPIELKRKESVYTYTDLELEKLTEMQKLLLRMGPENVTLIQTQARNLRGELLRSTP